MKSKMQIGSSLNGNGKTLAVHPALEPPAPDQAWRAEPDAREFAEEAVIRKFLDLSTAHVSPRTAAWLEQKGLLSAHGQDTQVAKYAYGWFVYADPEPEEDVPQELHDLMAYARRRGCAYILLDRDAEINHDLPTFEW